MGVLQKESQPTSPKVCALLICIVFFFFFFESKFIVHQGRASCQTLHLTMLPSGSQCQFHPCLPGHPQHPCKAHPKWSLPMRTQHRNTVFRCTIIGTCAGIAQIEWICWCWLLSFMLLLCTSDCLCNRHDELVWWRLVLSRWSLWSRSW